MVPLQPARHAKGWTQQELAKKARVTQVLISQFGSGEESESECGPAAAHRARPGCDGGGIGEEYAH
jgi:transcriptional regulator with XRE-family HTH domain